MKDFIKLYKHCKLLSWKEFIYLTYIYFNGFNIPSRISWINGDDKLREFNHIINCWNLGTLEII